MNRSRIGMWNFRSFASGSEENANCGRERQADLAVEAEVSRAQCSKRSRIHVHPRYLIIDIYVWALFALLGCQCHDSNDVAQSSVPLNTDLREARLKSDNTKSREIRRVQGQERYIGAAWGNSMPLATTAPSHEVANPVDGGEWPQETCRLVARCLSCWNPDLMTELACEKDRRTFKGTDISILEPPEISNGLWDLWIVTGHCEFSNIDRRSLVPDLLPILERYIAFVDKYRACSEEEIHRTGIEEAISLLDTDYSQAAFLYIVRTVDFGMSMGSTQPLMVRHIPNAKQQEIAKAMRTWYNDARSHMVWNHEFRFFETDEHLPFSMPALLAWNAYELFLDSSPW
jgi:hypothetical protein